MQTLVHAEPVAPIAAPLRRLHVRGKFLYAGDEKFFVRGTTYGTFACDEHGRERFHPSVVERDFACMTAIGINAVRTYTVPPLWLLDLAQRYRLRVMVGLPWEQHVAFLDDRELTEAIEKRVAEQVASCSHHPAILCYAVANEIPSSIVRWLGPVRVEGFTRRLIGIVKRADPAALVTYVNYPTTEHLRVPDADLVCFNVYLESKETLSAYLARLQNLAGERPLVMAEVGLDSRRNGEESQAGVLDWQLRTIFESACAGAFVFAWTDEWHRGGLPIDDWDFGLTRRDRTPKAALAAVARAYAQVPFREDERWPRVSVVVCAFNAEPTIAQCLDGLRNLDYPDYEVIVVDDGSTDATARIATRYDVRLISTENRGLSNARNTGLAAATGEIVAYLDSDAFPDEHWLKHLAATFERSNVAGTGGPNLAPPGLGSLAECFDNAPGLPTHVLSNDREAEHLPGCNMAFRKSRLEAVGGFDPALRVAGDDVDLCWRMQDRGWHLGFSPGAVVWHHRRTTLRSYWKQQRGYGRAEALLERKWPEKYNALGHTTWGGRIYARTATRPLGFKRPRIYQGLWGSAPFQPMQEPAPGEAFNAALMPEWYLLVALLGVVTLLGLFWTPLFLAGIGLAAALGVVIAQARRAAASARFDSPPPSRFDALRMRAVVAFLHLVQPLARLSGRLQFGLSPWRSSAGASPFAARPSSYRLWSETFVSTAQRLAALETIVRKSGARIARGTDFDRWDLETRGGALGYARLLGATEEHGSGKQLALFRIWPGCSRLALISIAASAAVAAVAALDQAWVASGVLGAGAIAIALRTAMECGTASRTLGQALHELGARP